LHGVESALRNAYAEGTVLSGWSAGCLCWFEGGVTDSFTPNISALRDGLGILSGSACPHYDSQEGRRPVYAREIAAGLPPGIALEHRVAARHDHEQLSAGGRARPDGRALFDPEGTDVSLTVSSWRIDVIAVCDIPRAHRVDEIAHDI